VKKKNIPAVQVQRTSKMVQVIRRAVYKKKKKIDTWTVYIKILLRPCREE
jgi:hypothetical protein